MDTGIDNRATAHQPVTPVPDSAVPGSDAMVLAELIDEAVHVRTGHRVRGLRVVVDQGHITLRGRCESFHIKQLAQHAVMRLGLDERLSNRIEVD